jgi:hypothetical protein
MTVQTLTPTRFVKNFAGLNITPLLAAPTQLTLEFTNSGHEMLFVSASTSGVTVQVNIGATILGQPVTQPTAVTLISGDVYAFGPYDTQVDQPGTTSVEVALSTLTGVTAALLQMVGTA